jgi:uncharacterized protein
MIEAILKNSESVANLCRLHGVTKLELFGSAARESDFDPKTSDLDFAVEFASVSPGTRFHELLSLQDDLSSLFSRKVDLVEIKDVKNPYVLKTILEDKRSVYVAA